MRISKLNLKNSFFSLLGYHGTAEEFPQPLRLEELRLAMLATLGEAASEQHAQVARKLRGASDALALWYSRSELMVALSSIHGETRARQEMNRLSDLFQGLLPEGLTAASGSSPR
jgi:hypothetical protein